MASSALSHQHMFYMADMCVYGKSIALGTMVLNELSVISVFSFACPWSISSLVKREKWYLIGDLNNVTVS